MNNKKSFACTTIFLTLILCVLVHPGHVAADDSQTLSVTPPLFQMAALPGDFWSSSIKVINSNEFPLTVYAEVVNFAPFGEEGQGKFIPIVDTGNEAERTGTLAEWIHISSGPYIIEPEQTQEIPFYAELPKDAAPGGHYAAILISTEPPQNDGGMAVLTSQTVTSLFFLRVEGDIHEEGNIREFRPVKSFLSTPDVSFSLRFENKGNVHLQPKGNVEISNMWGTARGSIPINYQTHFGNVLPKSIREYLFSWKSEFRITDIGRYKAVATLMYGEDNVKSTTSTTYFWVVPIKGTLITLSILITFIAFVVFVVKAYVRRMLKLAGVDPELERRKMGRDDEEISDEDEDYVVKNTSHTNIYKTVSAPIRYGVLDLRQRLEHNEDDTYSFIKIIIDFVLQYKRFFISILILIVIFIATVLYIDQATEKRTDYEVTVQEGGAQKVLDGETIEAKQ